LWSQPWFVGDAFDESRKRAQALGGAIEEPPNTDNGTLMRAFVIENGVIEMETWAKNPFLGGLQNMKPLWEVLTTLRDAAGDRGY
jgi:hypothetical protein